MAIVTCAISGIKFQVSYFSTNDSNTYIPHTEGYYHPIFAAPHKTLYSLYSKHTKNMLTTTESYLLYLAFLHSSDKVIWDSPASCDPKSNITIKIIENSFSQLLNAIEQTATIINPRFKQPKFRVTRDNSDLRNLPLWIEAWLDNISDFKEGIATELEYKKLIKVENRLTKLILSGESPEKYASVVSDWAAKAADFPNHSKEKYKHIINSCFSTNKMFNTPLAELREVKEFCESNIEAGSIHFHTLMKVLNEGIYRHTNYLGGSSLALGYTLLDLNTSEGRQIKEAELKTAAELAKIVEKAPETPPNELDYPDS